MALKITLITGRTINQGVTIENKTGQDYLEAAACCELNSKNIGLLGGNPGSNVRVKTEHGEVVVKLK
ncbi:MAG: tRNA CCA-pyrophosphorylase, partial [Candidatus Methanoperedens sp.]